MRTIVFEGGPADGRDRVIPDAITSIPASNGQGTWTTSTPPASRGCYVLTDRKDVQGRDIMQFQEVA